MTQVWRGIPYAEPVSGGRRWLPPVGVDEAPRGAFAPSAWQGVLPCGDLTPLYAAGQPSADDCLALNVFAPDTDGPHPVLVWVHGGGLVVGDAANPLYDGASLAARGVVVVTLNYRLGHQGFLPLPGSANRGLLDVVEALRWVQRCVPAYGGDPARVTVAGHSGGASLVLALLGSPLGAGLFRRAAMLSPTQTPFVRAAGLAKAARRYLDLLPDGDRATGQEAVAAGAALDAELLARPLAFGAAGRRRSAIGLGLGTPELPVHPLRGLEDGAGAEVDVLVGSTADEWRFYTQFMGTPTTRWATAVMAAMALGPRKGLLGVLRLGDTDRVMTAAAFALLAHRVAQAHQGRSWVYESGVSAQGLAGRLGAGHGSDLPHWLGNAEGAVAALLGPAAAPTGHLDALAAFVSGEEPWSSSYPHVEHLGPRHPRSLDRGRLAELAGALA